MEKFIWKGDLSFGLVSIPVAIMTAEKNNDIAFHLLDPKDHSRIQYKRVNAATGKEVPWDKIVKGYEYEKEQYLIVDEKAFEKHSPEIFKTIDIEEFIDFQEVDSMYLHKAYYLIPTSKNKKGYVILREALKKTHKAGVANIMLRTKEHLSLILPHDKFLLLFLIHYKDELIEEKTVSLPDLHPKVTDREMKVAEDLIENLSVKWKPEKYHNQYREALQKWINKKVKQKTKPHAKKIKTAQDKDIHDFITLLKQSLKKKKRTHIKRSK